jgi:hypothetical protein
MKAPEIRCGRRGKGVLAGTMAAVLMGAITNGAGISEADPVTTYPTPDAELGEALQPNEIEAAQGIADVIVKALGRKYGPGNIRRDAHPKAHGCVRANFTVEQDLDEKIAHGAFVPGRTYPAWIRFSNGDENPNRPDIEGDGRGMAIKLMHVEGKTLIGDDAAAGTLDFIMISHPVFLINDSSDYLSLVETVNSTSTLTKLLKPVLVPFSLGVNGTKIAFQTTRKKIENPLKTRYWSMVPYQLGEGPNRNAIKFSAQSCGYDEAEEPQLPESPQDDYLRTAMAESLDAEDQCMEFLVQPRTSQSMSVEDSQTEWLEVDAPFYKVATITIPKQTFDMPELNTFCESLSFNPWRTLAAHRPLGAVNRMRKVIYERVSSFRRSENEASIVEPTPNDPLYLAR